MTYLEAINRLLRTVLVLTGDDDNLTTLTSTQHQTTSNLAQIAIQDELTYNAALFQLDTERGRGSILCVQGNRFYDLPDDFARMYGTDPFLTPSDNVHESVYEFPGGFDDLRDIHREWETQQGRPRFWYFEENDSQIAQIATFPIPDAVTAGVTYTFEYEKTRLLSLAADILPFQNDMQSQAFVSMASRRWKLLAGELQGVSLDDDAQYNTARAAFIQLQQHRKPPERYGRRYNTNAIRFFRGL